MQSDKAEPTPHMKHRTSCQMSSALQKRFRARDEAARPNGNVQTGKRLGSGIQHAFPTDDDAPMLPTRRLLAGVPVWAARL